MAYPRTEGDVKMSEWLDVLIILLLCINSIFKDLVISGLLTKLDTLEGKTK